MRTTSLPWLMGAAAIVLSGCTEDIPNVTPFGDTEESTGTPGDDGGSTLPADDGGATSTTGGDSSTGPGGGDDTTTASSSEEDDDGGALCGDGTISGNEECDCGGAPCTVDGLGGNTCPDVADPLNPLTLTGGTLNCNAASCKYDYSECTFCGDRSVNGNETCEPEQPIAETCMSLGKGGVGDLSCDALCQIDTAGCTECGGTFNFDVKNCPGGWEVELAAGGAGLGAPSWACGEPTEEGPSMSDGGVWATNLSGFYNANEASALISPTIDLTACAAGEGVEMRVYHWFEFEGGPSNADGGIVQVSSNGTSWTTIEPTSGTLYLPANLNTAFPPTDGAHGFSGNDPEEGEWVQSNFDVSAWSGEDNLQVRFVFGSDADDHRAGWYIDRVEFVGSGV
jgi:hypothetical protein